jgi:2-succinyl-5-enolpyruvyl-6-hydroxy-3-cyclohexene-1-carboxylate synthase
VSVLTDPVGGEGGGAEPGDPLAHLADVARRSGAHSRTVVLAGHDAGEVAADFAAALKLPLLAEPSSNARFGAGAVSTYQFLLRELGPQIDTVILFGRPTLSRPQSALLSRDDIESWMYLPRPVAWFQDGRRKERVSEDLKELARAAGTPPEGWTQRWLDTDAAVRDALDSLLRDHEARTGRLTGPGLAATAWDAAGLLVLGSSRPIRDLDLMALPDRVRGRRTYANRGLAGIDGTIATASGISLGEGRRTLALMGDVTFLHDVGGLLTPSDEQAPGLDVIVAQDDGGTIFSTLEHGRVAEDAAYTAAVDRFFRTPHGLSPARIAEAYGWETSTAVSRQEVADWTARGRDAVGCRLLEVAVETADPRGLHRRLALAADEVMDRLRPVAGD